ncbi:MAG: hypothetical protein J6S85_06655 [Methanobrevibacter sp.]|nr:hypothetical protein [Methanobrevibacter sp.]
MWRVLAECENHPIILGLGIVVGASVIGLLRDEGYISTPREMWNDFFSDRQKRLIEEIKEETEKVKKERDAIYERVRKLLSEVKWYLPWEWPKSLPDEDKEKERKRLVIFFKYLHDWKAEFYPLYLNLYGLRLRDIRKRKWVSHVRFWEDKRERICFLLSELTPQILSLKEWINDEKNEKKKEVEISFLSLLEEIRYLDKWEKTYNLKG